MKIYSKENYESFEAFEADFNAALSVAVGLKVTCTKYGEGQIKSIYLHSPEIDFGGIYLSSDPILEIFMDAEFACGQKTFMLSRALKTGFLQVDEVTILAINEAFDILKDSEAARRVELEEAIHAQYEADRLEREELAAKRNAEKEAAKFALKKEQSLAKLNKIKPENSKKLFGSPHSFYEALGWMAKHVKNIKPTMPDYMEPWFIANFGDVKERYVVDSQKKTSGGFAYQWSLGFKMTFDEEVSGPLVQKATSKNKKAIDSVAFIWDLIENHGFKFGKVQDLDKIIDEVPVECLNEFKRGYAL